MPRKKSSRGRSVSPRKPSLTVTVTVIPDLVAALEVLHYVAFESAAAREYRAERAAEMSAAEARDAEARNADLRAWFDGVIAAAKVQARAAATAQQDQTSP